MLRFITLSLLALLITGCASPWETAEGQSAQAQCDSQGGKLYVNPAYATGHSYHCVGAEEVAASERKALECLKAGGEPRYNESLWPSDLYTKCAPKRVAQQAQPYVWKKSSVPDIEVEGYKPTTCRTTVNGNTADTRCF